MNETFDPTVFETLIHLLEFSVVIGIGVIVYITKRYSKEVNRELEKKVDAMGNISEE